MLEALCAWYLYKRVRSLLLAVTIYWVAIGWILDLVIYVAWVGLTREYVVLLLVKQQVNGSSPAEDALVKDCTTSTYKLMRLSRIPHGGICANNVQTVGPISRLISTFPVSPPVCSPEGRYSCRAAHIGASEAGFPKKLRGDSYQFRFRLRTGKSAFARKSGIGNNSSNHS